MTTFNFLHIPEEILCFIFSFIEDEVQLSRLAEVCKLWYKISRKKCLWNNLPQKRFSINFPKKRERDCSCELFSILYQELRWVVDNKLTEGLNQDYHHHVFFEPTAQNGK